MIRRGQTGGLGDWLAAKRRKMRTKSYGCATFAYCSGPGGFGRIRPNPTKSDPWGRSWFKVQPALAKATARQEVKVRGSKFSQTRSNSVKPLGSKMWLALTLPSPSGEGVCCGCGGCGGSRPMTWMVKLNQTWSEQSGKTIGMVGDVARPHPALSLRRGFLLGPSRVAGRICWDGQSNLVKLSQTRKAREIMIRITIRIRSGCPNVVQISGRSSLVKPSQTGLWKQNA